MYNRSIPKQHHYYNTSKIEGVMRSLRAMQNLLIGKQYIIYTHNWSVLRALRGQSQQDVVIYRLMEIIYWYPEVQFVAGKENGLADYLSRFHMHKSGMRSPAAPKEITGQPLQVHDAVNFLGEDQKLVQLWRFLNGHQRDVYLSNHMSKQLAWEVQKYVLEDGCLMPIF